MSLEKLKQHWEELAELDPLWAILVSPNRKFGRWNIDEFFLTGKWQIEETMKFAVSLGYPLERCRVLDFGCGVGRLSRALAGYFQTCYGLDISEGMIRRARELNQSIENCKFITNSKEDLQIFPSDYFDMVYSPLVLQHLPWKDAIRKYIQEFMRTLKPNGLVAFQVPGSIGIGRFASWRRIAYSSLRSLGLSPPFLYNNLRLHPMSLNFLPRKRVVEILEGNRARILHIQPSIYRFVHDYFYYATKSQPGEM